MADTAATTAAAGAPMLPLFYRELQPLSSQVHAGWRLKAGDVSFAAETPFVPIVVGEIAVAARSYPIVFAADSAQPVAVLGLERRNLFVEDGRWMQDSYVPAYVRRYPFAFLATVNPEGFALAIDSGSDRIDQGGSEGSLLFTDGKPSDLTRQALAFCDSFQAEAAATKAFTDGLKEQDLLIDRRADATLPDGRKLGLEGFQVVDAEKFGKLADDVVLDWHRKGWLALVHFHLASLERFNVLLSRQALVASNNLVMQPSSTDASEAAGDAASPADAQPADPQAPAAAKSKKA